MWHIQGKCAYLVVVHKEHKPLLWCITTKHRVYIRWFKGYKWSYVLKNTAVTLAPPPHPKYSPTPSLARDPSSFWPSRLQWPTNGMFPCSLAHCGLWERDRGGKGQGEGARESERESLDSIVLQRGRVRQLTAFGRVSARLVVGFWIGVSPG